MKEYKRYFTLRYERGDGKHKAGEKVVAAEKVVRLGQQEDCDVRFDNPTDFADETFAVVRPSRDGAGWKLIVCSENFVTKVNGVRIEMIHSLADGDHIAFDGIRQELVFNVHEDNVYSPANETLHVSAPMSRKLIALLIAIPVLLFVVGGLYIHHMNTQEEVRNGVLDKAKGSVFQLSVNSAYLEMIVGRDTTCIDSFAYEGKGICGTAFLTTDSLIVTARHCIEPWLNDGDIMQTDDPRQLKSKVTRWALMAETYNQTHSGDTLYKVVSVFSLYSGDKGETLEGRYRSDQFAYDSSRDDIIEKGDFTHEYYWRSLLRRHARKDMMLGDVATIKVYRAGNIALADNAKMTELVQEHQRLDFIGYPAYAEEGQEKSTGEVKRYRDASGEQDMIAHNGKLTYGYSGGPALVVNGTEVYAVGVVSVTETVGDRMYSVPVTEIKREGGKR